MARKISEAGAHPVVGGDDKIPASKDGAEGYHTPDALRDHAFADAEARRGDLDVYSTTETDAAISAAVSPVAGDVTTLDGRVTAVEGDVAAAETAIADVRKNFAGATAPADPEIGWHWFDTGAGRTKVFDGAEWVEETPAVEIDPADDLGGEGASDDVIPSQLAVKTFVEAVTIPASALDTDAALTADSDVKIASQRAVKAYADGLLAANDAFTYKGGIDCTSNPDYPAADAGDVYRITGAGKVGGASGPNVEVGDRIECFTDATASGDHATVGANWLILQKNIDGAVSGPALATDGAIALYDGTSGKQIKNGAAPSALPVTTSGSTTARTLAARFAEWFNVKDYGAAGDGSTDDTAEIQAAFDACEAAGGGVVYFPPGVYRISLTIEIGDDTTVFGYGAWLRAVTLVSNASFPTSDKIKDFVETDATTYNPRPLLSNTDPANGNSNIKVFGLGLWAQYSAAISGGGIHGTMFCNVQGLVCRDMNIKQVSSGIAALYCRDFDFSHNRVREFFNGAIDTWTGCKHGLIFGNDIDGTDNPIDGADNMHGIFVTQTPTDDSDPTTRIAEAIVVQANRIRNIASTGDGSVGIWAGGSNTTRPDDLVVRVKILHNLITGADYGISLERGYSCELDGNDVEDCDYYGIQVRGPTVGNVDDLTIRGGTLRNCGSAGQPAMYISRARKALIQGVRVRGSAHTYAIVVDNACEDVRILDYDFDAGITGTISDSGTRTQVRAVNAVLPVLFAKSGAQAGSHTGTTDETVLATVSLPVGTLGANGVLRLRASGTLTSSVNNKTVNLRLGGVAGTVLAQIVYTTNASWVMDVVIQARNATNAQICSGYMNRQTDGLLTRIYTTAAVDMAAAARDLVITGQLANTGETITVEAFEVELIKSA